MDILLAFAFLLGRTDKLFPNLSYPAYCREISRKLNEGESLYALRRDLHYANHGTVRRRHPEQQTEQAWCLTVLTNAVITWTTEYYAISVGRLRAARSPTSCWRTSRRHTARTSTFSAPGLRKIHAIIGANDDLGSGSGPLHIGM
ncbi:Tn3 family transposase [Micromonospora sp. NPDC050417]|uniref:Tn3 family transposase n=1 Tax=Micromonospora sp. NPDC050417 TaxID=3364280 RepID=UPI0037BA7824